MSSGDKQGLNELLHAGGYNSDIPYSQNLAEASKNVQKRVCALKQYQLEAINLEGKFYERVHELEKEFEPLFAAIAQRVNLKSHFLWQWIVF